jgi:nitroimidazol reductase NimA-like FMN-containing flavoprotein (pyridoxamine 5'-phosphate oxidase superfamily)
MSVLPSSERLVSMIHEHAFGVLATGDAEYPYTSLVTIAVSEDHESLVFPTLRETRKYANIVRDPRVSILLDNRSASGNYVEALYALSLFGTAREFGATELSARKDWFSLRHPHLRDFLALPQTALIQVAVRKIILVEKFQEIHQYDWPLR